MKKADLIDSIFCEFPKLAEQVRDFTLEDVFTVKLTIEALQKTSMERVDDNFQVQKQKKTILITKQQ